MNKIQSYWSNSPLFFTLHLSELTNHDCKIVSLNFSLFFTLHLSELTNFGYKIVLLHNGDEKQEKKIELRRK